MSCSDFDGDGVRTLDDMRILLAFVSVKKFYETPTLSQVQSYLDDVYDSGLWPEITVTDLPTVEFADFDDDGEITIDDVRIYDAWVFVNDFVPNPSVAQVQGYIDTFISLGQYPSITVVTLPVEC